MFLFIAETGGGTANQELPGTGSSSVTAAAKSGGATAKRESIGESTRRHSSTTQDLNEFIYSVAEEVDADVADDDDVFEMDSNGGGPGSSSSDAASDAKRRTQSLGSLSGAEPKSPRKVLSERHT